MTIEKEELLAFANSLADCAAEIVCSYYRKPRSSLGINVKEDASPIVTLVDRAVETKLREMVHNRWPDHGVIGEEFESISPDAKYLWVFDPIDGTVAFSMGKPTFGTLIALFEDHNPILGIIDQPIQKERWIGLSGHPTLLNGCEVQTQPAQSITSASLAINGVEHLMGSEKHWQQVKPLQDACHVYCYGGDCYNFGLLANGHVDIVIEASPDLCDFAAVIPVIEGAGGKITGWNGEPLTRHHKGGILASSSKELHEIALDIINQPTSTLNRLITPLHPRANP